MLNIADGNDIQSIYKHCYRTAVMKKIKVVTGILLIAIASSVKIPPYYRQNILR